MPINFLGVFVGLTLSIILIVFKLNPVSAMFLGTVVGSLLGGASLHEMLWQIIIPGVESVTGIIIRIIAGGVLAGVLIESGAAESIARSIVTKLGDRNALLALALSSMILLAVGIFLPVSVVILAPIALSVAHKAGISKLSAILALSGGGKAGNLISPNPNTISAAEAFDLPLGDLMIQGFIPALAALLATVILANLLKNKGFRVKDKDLETQSQLPIPRKESRKLPAHIKANVDVSRAVEKELPPFSKAITAPLVAIILLLLKPVGDFFDIGFLSQLSLDSFIVLPIGAVTGMLVMGKGNRCLEFINKGITRMAPVVLMLVGAGALTGLIRNSVMPELIITSMNYLGIPMIFIAPISGAVMGAATGSAATGVIIAGPSFANILLAEGIPALSAAIMIHAGAALFDIVPHGNYFLASKDSMKVGMLDRLKVIPYEALIGLFMVTVTIFL